VIPQQKAGPYNPSSPGNGTRQARKPSSWSRGTNPGGLARLCLGRRSSRIWPDPVL